MTDLFRTVLSCEVLAVFVMAAVMLARLVLRKLPKRLTILLWLIVCLRLLVPVRLEAPISLVPETASDLSSEIQHISASGELSNLSQEFSRELRPHYVFESNRDKAYTARQWGGLALDLSPYFWILGAAGLFLAQLRKLCRLRKRLEGAEEISPGVYVSNRISGAFVLGLFRPDIYLPEGLDEEARRFVLLHERTHIERLDHVWKLLAFFCLCLHWFDPLVWVCFALFLPRCGSGVRRNGHGGAFRQRTVRLRRDASSPLGRKSPLPASGVQRARTGGAHQTRSALEKARGNALCGRSCPRHCVWRRDAREPISEGGDF